MKLCFFHNYLIRGSYSRLLTGIDDWIPVSVMGEELLHAGLGADEFADSDLLILFE